MATMAVDGFSTERDGGLIFYYPRHGLGVIRFAVGPLGLNLMYLNH
jgi:hypothetical protein